jgi:CRISPR associated protein.
MSVLRLVSLPVDLREFRRLAALRDHASDEGLALHHLLSESFGKRSLQPFRLMVAPGGRAATLYAYTSLTEEGLRENLDCAAPEHLKALETGHLAIRDMPDVWREGRRLGFDVRVRPVRRLMRPLEGWSREEHRRGVRGERPRGPIAKGSEVDAFLVARLRRFPDGLPDAETNAEGLSREAVYLAWLAEQFEGAATLDPARTRLAAHGRRRVARPDHQPDGVVVMSGGPDVVFHGELTITDGEAFSRLLARGVGRHAAYGYGMLLLRPGGG